MGNISGTARQDMSGADFSGTYLTFQIDGQYYGIPISNVIEILQLQPSTELPELPYYSKGVINLRGRVIPLIDVSLRFGKPDKDYTDRACIIIVDIDGHHTGLIVDAVEDVRSISGGEISLPPVFHDRSKPDYITSIAKPGNSMILLLDVRLLVLMD